MAKLPAFQFYPGDWMKDPSVRSLSYAARGLWTDMLCLMHASDRRGYLQLNGKPVTAEQLARMTGGSTDEVSRLLQELENSGVFSCTDHGVIYSRRMVRDEKKRQKCSVAGRKGGGNPKLRTESTFKGGSKGGSKGAPKGEGGSSSSSSTSVIPPNPPKGDGVAFPPGLDTPAFRAAWADYEQHRREIRAKRLGDTARRHLLNRLMLLGEERAIAAIRHSISQGWQGIFEPDKQGRCGVSSTPSLLPADEWAKKPYSPG